MTRAALLALASVLASGACHPAPRPAGDGARLLDGFEDLAGWRALGSDGVTSAVRAVPGVRGRALHLAVDLGGTAGYAVARRALALELPADFTLSFELRGDIPPNNLELKLIDDTGDNVWWYRRASYEFPASWRHITVERRQIEFAWGPTADRTLRRIAAIELVVSAAGGGKGWIEVDDLALAPVPAGAPGPRATASSWRAGGEPGLAIDGDPATAWASDPAAGADQRFTLDLGRERALGGLLVRWADGGAATDYQVELSRDGAAWQPVGRVAGGDGGLDPFVLPETGAQFVRLAIAAGSARGYRLAELIPLDAGGDGTWVARGNALIAALASRVPRGSLPRGSSGEQTYWTVVGIDGGARNSLMSEDGTLEIAGGASLEPFVEVGGRAIGWAGAAAIHQALDGGYLPIPSVTWRMPGWELEVTAVAVGDRGASQIAARYTLRNTGDAPLDARLVLAVRPLQVDPPTQQLNRAGG
ncbi:MAG TPA: discoidin domain-containing protein, partial [Kofleriaceae bacterium]|nr:discoidin domain-containing protein [Kofleriaceae bacterium]